MEFLGHKRGLAPQIARVIGRAAGPAATVLDAFCGTAAVAEGLRARGNRVHANDHLELCAMWARARLLAPARPPFAGLAPELGPLGDDPYAEVVRRLNEAAPVTGFLAQHYTPLSRDIGESERRYLSVANGRRADAIRERIRQWRPLLTEAEHALLLRSLVAAVVAVSNIAGTYGSYLKEWKPRALAPLRLEPQRPAASGHLGHTVTCADGEAVSAQSSAEVLYADPPYTKRQYAAYYHLLETLVVGDAPAITGSTGLRPWKDKASDWCYRRLAPRALERLMAKSAAPVVVLSYNDDGQVPHETVLEVLRAHGRTRVHEWRQRRYKSSRQPHKGAWVVERLYVLSR